MLKPVELKDSLLKEIKEESKQHEAVGRRCTVIYYILGGTLVTTNVIITSVSGGKGLNGEDEGELVIFFLALFAAILSVLLGFLKIETRISGHLMAAEDYEALHNDMQLTALESRMGSETFNDIGDTMKRKQLIDKHAPVIGSSCLTI